MRFNQSFLFVMPILALATVLQSEMTTAVSLTQAQHKTLQSGPKFSSTPKKHQKTPVAPAVPNQYTLDINRFYGFTNNGTGGSWVYDWTSKQQVSVHPDYCIAGPIRNQSCRVVMKSNMTLLVQSAKGKRGTCCRFPDGDVPLPSPRAYSYWNYVQQINISGYPKTNPNSNTSHDASTATAAAAAERVVTSRSSGNVSRSSVTCNEWTMYGFKWFVDIATNEPMRFQFGGGNAFTFAAPIEPNLPSDWDQLMETPDGCEDTICKFCWFPPSPACPYH